MPRKGRHQKSIYSTHGTHTHAHGHQRTAGGETRPLAREKKTSLSEASRSQKKRSAASAAGGSSAGCPGKASERSSASIFLSAPRATEAYAETKVQMKGAAWPLSCSSIVTGVVFIINSSRGRRGR